MRVGSTYNVVSLNPRVCNLASHIFVGQTDYQPVLGCVVFVLVLKFITF